MVDCKSAVGRIKPLSMVEIRTLEGLSFDKIAACFLKAFHGYFVKMPDDPEYYRNRWLAAGLRYDFSYGAFYHDQLVGFVLHCIDQRDGHKIAFNTGTGVIPEFRGNHIISQIYEYALPTMASSGISMSKLEVIQQNFTALRIYERTGFEITRDYKCFQGKITSRSRPANLKAINCGELEWDQIPNQQVQSWDHQRNSLVNGPYQFYQALLEGQPIGMVALNLPFRYMALCEITTGTEAHWDSVLSAVGQLCPTVKINNVDSRLTPKLQALVRAGLTNNIDQYEMELKVNQYEAM